MCESDFQEWKRRESIIILSLGEIDGLGGQGLLVFLQTIIEASLCSWVWSLKLWGSVNDSRQIVHSNSLLQISKEITANEHNASRSGCPRSIASQKRSCILRTSTRKEWSFYGSSDGCLKCLSLWIFLYILHVDRRKAYRRSIKKNWGITWNLIWTLSQQALE